MKLNKLTKGLVASAALTAAGFANASAISSASSDITNLTVGGYSDAAGSNVLLPGLGFGLSDVKISFGGTSVSTDFNGNGDSDAFTGSISDPFAALSSIFLLHKQTAQALWVLTQKFLVIYSHQVVQMVQHLLA